MCQQLEPLHKETCHELRSVPLQVVSKALDTSTKTVILSHIRSPFTPKALYDYIEKTNTITTIAYGGDKLCVHCVGIRSSNQDFDIVFLSQCKQIIVRIITLMKWCSLSFPFDIWVIPTSWDRYLPDKGEEVTPKNINGGFTYIDNTESTQRKQIFVYRKEEFAKVILHEVLHHSSFHIHHWDDASLQLLYRALHVDQDGCQAKTMRTCSTRVEPNEAVIETWAELIQCAFLHIEYGIPWKDLIEKEIAYNVSKAYQLLEHRATMPKRLWKEQTHALSYTIIRGILLCNYASWMQMAHPYESTSVTKFLLQHLQGYIDEVMVQKDTYFQRKNTRLLSSLRMTAVIGDF